MPSSVPKPGRWRSTRRAQDQGLRRPYRDPAPDPASRLPPRVEESGRYQALREHWLSSLLHRLLGH